MPSDDTTAFTRVIDGFIPRRVTSRPSPERTRARALVLSSLGVVAIGLASAFVALALQQRIALVVSLVTTAGFGAVPLVYRLSGSYRVAAWYFVVLGGAIAMVALPQTGGLYSTYVFWLPMLPAVVLVVLDYRAAVSSVFLVFGFAFVLVHAHGQGWIPGQEAFPTQPAEIARVLLFSALFFLAASYARERALEDLQSQQVTQARGRARAEAASRAKSSILASVSHELRTPMTGILGLTDMLSDTTLDERQRDWVKTIHKTGNALLALLDDLLDTARLDAGRLTLKPRPFRPDELAEQVMSLFQPRARAKGLALHLEVDASVPDRVDGDPARIRQVLTNLVGNAIKFTENGGVALSLVFHEGDLVFEITDSGVGIPPDRLQDVFAPFVRAEADATTAPGGVGLGLSIARLLVEAMEGEITVRSELGVGTTFQVSLPLQRVDDDVPTTESSVREPPPEGPSLRVLVAEDNPVNRMVLTALLETMGHEVHVAEDGGEVLNAARVFDPHIVLMDMRMPVLDGIEATRRLRADPRFDRLQIVALTANAFEEDRRACLEAGMDAFLTKPVNKDELYGVLARVPPRPASLRPAPT